MVFLVLLIVGLAIDVWHLLVGLWPLLVVVVALSLLCRWVVLPTRDARVQDARDRLRHERARREIDRIALEAERAMYVAAEARGDVIEGTAVEVTDR
jgi:hypothetical protein